MVTKVSLLFPNAINPVAVSWLPRWVEVVDSRTIEQDGSLDVVIAWGRKGLLERISHLTCPKIDVQHGVYDEVIVSPIEEYLNQSTETWDAILLLDVLEHFSHDTGSQLLAAARGRLSQGGQFFVGTPAVWIEQTAAYGNEFERHQSLWTAEELREAGFEMLDSGEPDRFGNRMLLGGGTSRVDIPPVHAGIVGR